MSEDHPHRWKVEGTESSFCIKCGIRWGDAKYRYREYGSNRWRDGVNKSCTMSNKAWNKKHTHKFKGRSNKCMKCGIDRSRNSLITQKFYDGESILYKEMNRVRNVDNSIKQFIPLYCSMSTEEYIIKDVLE